MEMTEFPLPEWAVRRISGEYLTLGAQLATRDGRRFGNAYVDGIVTHDRLGSLAVVVTDMGNSFRMTLAELEEGFYPPEYVMRIDEARRRRFLTVQTELPLSGGSSQHMCDESDCDGGSRAGWKTNHENTGSQ